MSLNPYSGSRLRQMMTQQADRAVPEKLNFQDVNAVARISIASPEQILNWSKRYRGHTDRQLGAKLGRAFEDLDEGLYGEVKKPETINYRTFKPEKDGLFCEHIFGPTKDWECACGKYKRIKYKGIICDRCGVEVTESKVRRQRMAHIKLAAPVCHIWFYKGTSSRISNLLDVSVRDLGKVIYFQEYIVVDPGDTPLQHKQVLTEDEARKFKDLYGDKVKIGIGAEAVLELLKQIDVEQLSQTLALEMRKATSAQRRLKIIKRLKVIEAFRGSPSSPQWMIITILPVIPPDLRPLVHLDGGRFATSDLNDLYRRVINRNNRLKRLMELRAPDVILRNEKRMLQEAVDALFDNSRRSRPTKGHNNRPLKSLSDMLKGKQGRFRQNLLGKRVDYSGRSVIVVGPELKFNECGLPKKMALELFDPFVIRELEKRGYVNTIKSAKKMMEREDPVVYDILDDIIKDHPVLLNRAPTLHRLGVQAFMPRLVEGKAIRLHPLSCTAFNADFDGDQMAVHVPLSPEAKMEAMMLMLAENNILSPATGRPTATPTQDIVLGCYYMTKMNPKAKGAGMVFASPEEALLACNCGAVHLQAEVRVRMGGELLKTSPGRVLFNSVLPPEVSYFDERHSFANTVMTKRSLGRLIDEVHKTVGAARTAKMLDDLMHLGFEHAKKAGISICLDDMRIPTTKEAIIEEAEQEVAKVRSQHERGLLTPAERYQKIIDIWTHASDRVRNDLLTTLRADQDGMNPIYMMMNSGARGNEDQIRQLAGMRGLMQRPTKTLRGGIGEIIENPIRSNFREGLTVLEYFISTHGARKGLADTALKTSDAGYLTRRLVDVAQDLIINETDCGTHNSMTIRPITEVTAHGERVLESLADRVAGRVAAEDVINPNTNEVICNRNDLITSEIAEKIEDAGLDQIAIRSVLTCETRRGVCAYCYGLNLATGKLVEMGEAVGVIAAQSIGEPGTQLTLRTFHIGGLAARVLEGWYQASQDGVIRYKNLRVVKHPRGHYVVINRTGAIHLEDEEGNVLETLPNIRYGAMVFKKDGESVKKDERFVEWDPHSLPIIAEVSGAIRLHDILPGVTMREEIDSVTGIAQRVVAEHKEDRHPQIQILDDEGEVLSQYALAAGTILARSAEDGARIEAGETVARVPQAKIKSKDITGGLPRVDELLEARKPKDACVMADIDGVIHIKGVSKGARKISIVGDDGQEYQYTIPTNRHLTVRDGERVTAGEQITDGSPNPHDILRIQGEKAVMQFIVSEVQEVYRLQGVSINDKHIECIVRQMLKKFIVDEVGNTSFLYDQQVDKFEFFEENERTIAKGGEPAKARPKLLGLTKASLETDSFISAASFQETTRVLTDAAVRGRVDYLHGLKENVIMGLLIPAGTGLPVYRNIEVKSAAQAEYEETAEEKEQTGLGEELDTTTLVDDLDTGFDGGGFDEL